MKFKIINLNNNEKNIEDEKIIKKLVEIEAEVFGEKGGADNWLMKFFARYGQLFILMSDEDEIISVAEFIQVFGKPEVFLYGFLTVPKFRNQGNAKKLLDFSEKKLKELNIKNILLTVDPKNEIGVNIYKKRNYEIVELQKDEYGTGIDRYLMKKNL